MTLTERYEAGESLREIGKSMGVSHETVRAKLIASGAQMRERGGPSGKRGPSLAAEVIGDLANFPNGVTLDGLVEWLGEDRRALLKALRRLIREGRIAVTALPERLA